MGSDTYHEPYEQLSGSTQDMHRALISLVEELEAIDWYGQRAEVTKDSELRRVLLHNRDEEIEHAMMNLEWIRRNDHKFDSTIRTYLLTEVPIVDIEEGHEAKSAAGDPKTQMSNQIVQDKRSARPTLFETNGSTNGLGLGTLKDR